MGALGSAITGLQASQKWLDVISNNISNSNTVAFKRGRTGFAWAFSDSVEAATGPQNSANLGGKNPTQVGLGVRVNTIQNIMKQGELETTGRATDVAIAGRGFFTVSKSDETYYTRSGNLTFDGVGNLVTPDGGLVQGWMSQVQRAPQGGPMTIIETVLDNSNPGALQNIRIEQNMVLAPRATSNQSDPTIRGEGVMLRGNLDNNTPFNAGSLQMGVGTVGSYASGSIPGPAPANAINGADLQGFTADATSSFTVYDSLGTQWDFTMLWQQVAQTPASGAVWAWTMWYTPGGASPDINAGWNTPTGPQAGAFVADSSGFVATGTNSFVASEHRYLNLGPAGTASGAVVFNPDGSLADNGAVDPATGLSPTNSVPAGNPANVPIDPLNIQFGLEIFNGAVGPGGVANRTLEFSVNMGTPNDPPPPTPSPPAPIPLPALAGESFGERDGLTGDFGGGTLSPLGVYSPVQTIYTESVDGYGEGNLLGLQVNIFGEIEGTFDNQQTVVIAQLAITRFGNAEGLESVGGNLFRQTANSGTALVGTAGANGFGAVYGGSLEKSNVDLTLELTNMILAQRMFESTARIVTAQDRVFDKLTELGR